MNIAQIEKNIIKLVDKFDHQTFIYDLLRAYGLPKASITRLQKGNLNLSNNIDEVSWKKKLYYKQENTFDLQLTLQQISKNLKHKQRFVVVTDFKTLVALDTKTQEKLDIKLKDLAKHYDFFLPWAGMEKAQHIDENPADVKAAENMAKLFAKIKQDNPNDNEQENHRLNLFLSRLLFCFFAEDTHIFAENQFTKAIASHTQVDGSDLQAYLYQLFTVLNTAKEQRHDLPQHLQNFPYVNGGLFAEAINPPVFSRRSRQAILDAGTQDWQGINPDIFGSMFQAVIGSEQRGSLGQHYTSVPNIMKVIEPLFLNDLYQEFEKAGDNVNKLKKILVRLHNLKIFDPACGSGNFLIIAYKQLRKLEMKIFKKGRMLALSDIHLSQFYGIEIDDFAGEIAKLALWLAEHQMNLEFYQAFGRSNPTLPLKEAGVIIQGNATRIDWEQVCPKNKNDEIYILGNPPFIGKKEQTKEQKSDIKHVFNGVKGIGVLDYVTAWYLISARFVNGSNIKVAFVSTNSISQGEQVGILWKELFNNKIKIHFAYQTFEWKNEAKGKAAVHVVIIGFASFNIKNKTLYGSRKKNYVAYTKIVTNINPYLVDGSDSILEKRRKPLSELSNISFGSIAIDKGHLILSDIEKKLIIEKEPISKKYILSYGGGAELLKGIKRWCYWLEALSNEDLFQMPSLKSKINKVKEFRLSSKRIATQKLAKYPSLFGENRQPQKEYLLIPKVSSETRDYIPIGFMKPSHIANGSSLIIENAHISNFGIIMSKIHMVWVKSTCGRMKSDYQYSNSLVYNTFPFPKISTQLKNEITQAVFRILAEREKHSEKTLAQLYDPDKMPEGLRQAHRDNDLIIERCYRSKPFDSDEERLEYLFKLYEKMIATEKHSDDLFAKNTKKGKIDK